MASPASADAMNPNHPSLFFIALLPPAEVQEIATKIKLEFAELYNSRAALKSPPHVTLQPPFPWQGERVPDLDRCLQDFTRERASIPMTLENFKAFKPRVIYIDVHKTPELVTLQKQLLEVLEFELNLIDSVSKSRPFSPHLTVGFRDLTREHFQKAWANFQERKLFYQFTVDRLTLLLHNGQRWEVHREYVLKTP
jgi:2'-5' RNA ligase